MNIKIKLAGVACLIGDNYDSIYATLRNQFGDGNEQLFTERKPGNGYLQWELPGEGWISLSESDPLMTKEVRKELTIRKQTIIQRFGTNQEMAQRILSVPDDSYIYYKASTDGQLLIRLTAWGYRYPERIGGGGTTGIYTPKGDTQFVHVYIMYDNKPIPNKELFVNGFSRVTDTSGVYSVGELPIGYKFEISVDGKQQSVEVQSGDGDIRIDVTQFASVEVRVTLDKQPYSGITANLSYWGHELALTTDSNGVAIAKVPKDPNNGMCTVSIEKDFQQQALLQPITVFSFDIYSPEEDMPEEEESEGESVNKTDEDRQIVNSEQEEEPKKEENEVESLTNTTPVSDQMEKNVDKQEQNEISEQEPSLPVNIDREQSNTPLILEVLASLSLLLLVALTYFFCYGMLFG